jgi:hypothetical protein
MKEPNIEELRRSGALLSSQTGAPTSFANSGFHCLRHAQNVSWWELVLGLISLGLIVFALFNILLRALGFVPPL